MTPGCSNPDPCKNHKCLNRGKCRAGSSGEDYTCRCRAGYGGRYCELGEYPSDSSYSKFLFFCCFVFSLNQASHGGLFNHIQVNKKASELEIHPERNCMWTKVSNFLVVEVAFSPKTLECSGCLLLNNKHHFCLPSVSDESKTTVKGLLSVKICKCLEVLELHAR